jgi:hypothetical protein
MQHCLIVGTEAAEVNLLMVSLHLFLCSPQLSLSDRRRLYR